MAALPLCDECGAALRGECCPNCGAGEPSPDYYYTGRQRNRARSLNRKGEPAVTDAHGRPIRLDVHP